MSQANTSPNWRDSGQPQPVVARRTHPRPSAGWWLYVGVICALICCVVALMVVLLIPPLTIKPVGPITMVLGYTPSAGSQQLLTGATLGGTLAGFDVAYGAPTHTTGDGARWERVAIAGQQVALAITFAGAQDGQPHVAGVSVSPAAHTSATWATATAQRIMASMLPNDSRLIRTDSSHPNTLTYLYTSALLGQTLLPAQSVNTSAPPAPKGEFNVVCQLASSGQISYCSLAPGAP